MLKKVGCGIAVLTLLPLAYAAKPTKPTKPPQVILVCKDSLTGASSISVQIDKIAPNFDFWTTTYLNTSNPLKGPVYTLVLTKMYEADFGTLKQYGGTATNLGNLNWTMPSIPVCPYVSPAEEVIGDLSSAGGTPGLVTYAGGPFSELAFNFHFSGDTPSSAIVDVNVFDYTWRAPGDEVKLVFEYRLLKDGVSLGTFTQAFDHFVGSMVDQNILITPTQ